MGLAINLFYSQKKVDSDTLQSWMSTFYTIGNLTVSDDGRFVALHKMYKGNNDTVLVFNSKKPNVPLYTLVKLNQQKDFVTHDRLLVMGNDRAELLDLNHFKKKVYEQVKQTDILGKLQQYLIFDQQGNVSIYDQNGHKIQSIDDVQGYVTDHQSKLYMYRSKKGKYDVLSFSVGKLTTVYATENEIVKMELVPSGKQLVITEKKTASINKVISPREGISETTKKEYESENMGTDSSVLSLTFINTITHKVLHPEGIPSGQVDFITVMEIQNGKMYVIDFDKRMSPVKKGMVEIWYGDDKELRSKKYGTQKHQYWLWDPVINQSVSLPQDHFSAFIPINDTRYLIAFSGEERNNYINPTPLYSLHIYDRQKNSYRQIFNQTFNLIGSSDGRYLIGYDEKYKSWMLYDMNTSVITPIKKNGLRSPVFSKEGHFILFESENDIWQMDLKTKVIQPLGIAEGKETRIINLQTENSYQQFNVGFEMNTVDLNQPLVVKIRDKKNNLTSYISWTKRKGEILLPPTVNRIKEVKLSPHAKRIFSIEESFNRPPEVSFYEGKEKIRRVLYTSGIKDTTSLSLRQDILSYTNAVGTALKGILWYPAHFNPAKKYPMVVRIYQKQSEASGIYSIPEFDEDGFNLRLLLERGYFVLKPDIVFDSRGTGISALDCVDKALDAVLTNPNINHKKIGLTGHSLGGYETNFIATKSDRFAAYISGSSVSDIVTFYFSYNTHFNIADYSRFETGQFEMNTPFSKDKERYFRNNPIIDVERVNAPMLLWAGMKDENVPPHQTIEFYMGLLRNKKTAVVLLYQNKGHDLGKGSEESKDLNIKTLEWWDYFLKDKKEGGWIKKRN